MNPVFELCYSATAGLRLADEWVWCGSALRGADGIHLYASCWSKRYPMFEGYILNSRIVHAFSPTPEGSYRVVDDIVPFRGGKLRMAHNPTVLARNGRYYLYFIGSDCAGTPDVHDSEAICRIYQGIRIYLGVADSPAGPWRISEEPILSAAPGSWDAAIVTNPAPCFLPDGSVYLYYRSNTPKGLRLGLARAASPEGQYSRLLDHPVMDGINIEDPFVWHDGTKFHMLAKDMTGTLTGELHAGALFESGDGIDWNFAGKGYSRTLTDAADNQRHFGSFERPQLLFGPTGKPEYLFAAAADGPGGFRKARNTWNTCARILQKNKGD